MKLAWLGERETIRHRRRFIIIGIAKEGGGGRGGKKRLINPGIWKAVGSF